MSPRSLVQLKIPADQVQNADLSGIEGWLASREPYPEMVRPVQGSVFIVFPEYDDADVVFLVPEVKAYLRKAHERIRHLFYYLVPAVEAGNMLMFLAVHAPEEDVLVTDDGRVGVSLSPASYEIMIDRMVHTAQFARTMAEDWRHVIWALLEPLDSMTVAQDFVQLLELGSNPGSQPDSGLRRQTLDRIVRELEGAST